MTRLKKLILPAYIFSSPWLLAAAAGLLIIIVLTFAFHNFKLDQKLMIGAMLQKAVTLMQVTNSGSRASYLNDLRKEFWRREAWPTHGQRVIDHLAEDQDLHFLALLDQNGKVLAHSNPERVGTVISIPDLPEKTNTMGRTEISYGVQDFPEYGRVFVAVRHFFSSARVPGMAMPPHGSPGSPNLRHRGRPLHEHREGPPLWKFFPDPGHRSNQPYFLLVGLDMQEFDKTLGRLQLQIIMLSVAMLLVGIGGWFSLSAIQGYRISQKTINDIQGYTSLLVARLPVGLIATDAAGKITTWNQAMEGLTGLAQQSVLTKTPKEMLPAALSVFFTEGEKSLGQKRMPEKNRGVRLSLGQGRCELLCHPLLMRDSEGQLMGQVLLVSDVTEIRSLEQRMRESERLAAVGKMAGGVAHEVRNPLSSIKGLALLLKNKFSEHSKESDTAELLIQETERINRVITEMLTFTRPMALHLEPVSLNALLQCVLLLVQSEADENQVKTELHTSRDLLPVRGDKDRLQQVMMNIFLNSLQAMEEGGRLSVSASNREDGLMVQLQISDTGKGMDADTLGQVFYPYFTTKQSGTGIGLSISQKIIFDHDGSIEMESEPGQGTRVVIQLPVWQ